MAERAVRKAHEKKDETEDKPFTCQYCGVEYTVKTVTSHYKRSHPDKYFTDGNVREEFKCSQCEEKYFAKSSKYLKKKNNNYRFQFQGFQETCLIYQVRYNQYI